MTPDNWLFIFTIALVAVTVYIIVTDTTTAEQKMEMLEDEEMWP